MKWRFCMFHTSHSHVAPAPPLSRILPRKRITSCSPLRYAKRRAWICTVTRPRFHRRRSPLRRIATFFPQRSSACTTASGHPPCTGGGYAIQELIIRTSAAGPRPPPPPPPTWPSPGFRVSGRTSAFVSAVKTQRRFGSLPSPERCRFPNNSASQFPAVKPEWTDAPGSPTGNAAIFAGTTGKSDPSPASDLDTACIAWGEPIQFVRGAMEIANEFLALRIETWPRTLWPGVFGGLLEA